MPSAPRPGRRGTRREGAGRTGAGRRGGSRAGVALAPSAFLLGPLFLGKEALPSPKASHFLGSGARLHWVGWHSWHPAWLRLSVPPPTPGAPLLLPVLCFGGLPGSLPVPAVAGPGAGGPARPRPGRPIGCPRSPAGQRPPCPGPTCPRPRCQRPAPATFEAQGGTPRAAPASSFLGQPKFSLGALAARSRPPAGRLGSPLPGPCAR